MLAIIPARGGSKGVPRKNIKLLNGKPLIYYTIKAAQKSNKISEIILSTEDEEIAEIGQKLGAKVPFLRPEQLASDTAQAIDTYIYTIDRCNIDYNMNVKDFIVLQPTSPFRRSLDIDNAIKTFNDKNAYSVVSVVEVSHPPYWYKRIDQYGILRSVFEDLDNNLNRQKYGKFYIPNGAIFIFNYAELKRTREYYTERTYPYIMPEINSLDIDTNLDFSFAEFLIKTF